MGLIDRLKAEIAATGPMSVAAFMERCLHDPRDGYYATRPALGPDGDFITAPLVSQMFGELIGLWAVETWSRMGAPADFDLVEIGPGDGTLIADVLRAARLAPAFLQAGRLVLVERSAPLKALQLQKAPRARHVEALSELDGARPLIVIANELLDCLPVRQYLRAPQGWAERRVGLDVDGKLGFGLSPAPRPSDAPEDTPEGQIWEDAAAQAAFAAELAALIGQKGGAALLIDYGRAAPGFGDTLQALHRHRKVDPLATAGQADLTVWADFPRVVAAARAGGAEATPILTQAEFLTRLGVHHRAEALKRARPDRAETLDRQLERLIAPDQMGELFKAVAIHAPGLAVPGFEEQP